MSGDWSMPLVPASTSPSGGTRSPGSITTSSPRATRSTGRRSSPRGPRTRAVSGATRIRSGQRPARPLAAARLQQLGQREQHDRGRALAPLADRHRAHDRDGHGRAFMSRTPWRARRARGARRPRRPPGSPAGRGGSPRAAKRTRRRGPRRQGHRDEVARDDAGARPSGAASFTGKPACANACSSRPGPSVMYDRSLAGDGRGLERAHAVQAADARLDQRDLGRAVEPSTTKVCRRSPSQPGHGDGLHRGRRPLRPSSAACDRPMSTSVRMCSSSRR